MSEKMTGIQASGEMLKIFNSMEPETMVYLYSLIIAPKISALKLERCGLVADLLKEGKGKMDLLTFLERGLPAEMVNRLEVKVEDWGAPGPDFRPVTLTMKGVTGRVELVLGKHKYVLNGCDNYIWTISEYGPKRFGGPVESWGFYDEVSGDGKLSSYCFPVAIYNGDEKVVAEIHFDGLEFLVRVLRDLYEGG